MSDSELVSTTVAARSLGISARTIQRYAAAGLVEPDLTLPGTGGRHEYRWNVAKLRDQINALASRGNG